MIVDFLRILRGDVGCLIHPGILSMGLVALSGTEGTAGVLTEDSMADYVQMPVVEDGVCRWDFSRQAKDDSGVGA